MPPKFDRSIRIKQQLNKRLKHIQQSNLLSISTPFQLMELTDDLTHNVSKIMPIDRQVNTSSSRTIQLKEALETCHFSSLDTEQKRKRKVFFPFMLQKNHLELRKKNYFQNVKELGIKKKSLMCRRLTIKTQRNSKAKSCSYKFSQFNPIFSKDQRTINSTAYSERMKTFNKFNLKPLSVNRDLIEKNQDKISPWNIYSPL